jgi:hypothetical protein
VSDSALEVPRAAGSAAVADRSAREPAGESRRGFVREHVWWAVSLAIVAFSIVLLLWARTRPSYDAFGWLVWGYQTVHGSLDLGGAPSWKPLPYVFTVPFAVFGRAQMWLWMVAAVSISLGGAVSAGRIAYRLTLMGIDGTAASETLGTPRLRPAGTAPGRHWAALAAGVFAGCALLGIEDYSHYILSVQSDPVIVACVVLAIDCYLCGRRRWAFWLLILAGLGRPEAWPWLALYSGWLWLRNPEERRSNGLMILAGAAITLFFWFGIPTITNNRPFVSAQLAFNSPRELKNNQVLGTFGRFTELHYLPVWLAALASVALAAWRRNRLVLILAACTAGWVLVEAAFALHGWPGLQRYMYEPAGVSAILGGTAVGWLLAEARNLHVRVPRWAGVPVVAALVLALIPAALAREHTEHKDLLHERGRTTDIKLLAPLIADLGGAARIRSCATPVVDVAWVSSLAYYMNMDVGFLGRHPSKEIHGTKPVLVFMPLSHGGWSTTPYHLHEHNRAACSSLKAALEVKPGHPGGVFVRR